MKPFLGTDFLLHTETARRLYHEVAEHLPIIDYHCHLPPREIAENRCFDNLARIWLEGDHYKWRAMRAAGVDEQEITGNASDEEKYRAWARTVPQCLGNPLYTWTHLELQRPFGISNTLLNPETAPAIWNQCNEKLKQPEFSARGIMQAMNVKMVGTTDDPADSLAHHKKLRDEGFAIQVMPSFRPDRACKPELSGFVEYLEQLGKAADREIRRFHELLEVLTIRLDHFAAHGCTLADHGIEIVRFAEIPSEQVLDDILARRLEGQTLNETDLARFFTAVTVWLGRQYAKRGWVMQFHMGAQRDNNTRMHRAVGPNTGFDSIGDRPVAEPLARLLDAMDQTCELPRTILYGINPADNEVLATMVGNFQDGSMPGKIQYGSAWWFNDQKDGMQRQLTQLAQLGLLSHFVGMLTDSRSFLSYTRHEYFRRILCGMIGDWVENGEAPNDWGLLSRLVADVCFNNANRYFGLKF